MPSLEDGSGFVLLSEPQTRVYYWPNDTSLSVEGVVKIRIAGGYEYLETADGGQRVIAPGWLSMSGSPAPWVFRP